MFYDLKGKRIRDYNMEGLSADITVGMVKKDLVKLVKDRKQFYPDADVMYRTELTVTQINIAIAVLISLGLPSRFHKNGVLTIIDKTLCIFMGSHDEILNLRSLEDLPDSPVIREVTDKGAYRNYQDFIIDKLKAIEKYEDDMRKMLIRPHWFDGAEVTELLPLQFNKDLNCIWVSDNVMVNINVFNKTLHVEVNGREYNPILGRLTRKYMTALLSRNWMTAVTIVEKQLHKEGVL